MQNKCFKSVITISMKYVILFFNQKVVNIQKNLRDIYLQEHSSNPPFFKGGITFPENGLKGGSKILVFRGRIPKRGGDQK